MLFLGSCLSHLLFDSGFHNLTIPISTAFPGGSAQQGLSTAEMQWLVQTWGRWLINAIQVFQIHDVDKHSKVMLRKQPHRYAMIRFFYQFDVLPDQVFCLKIAFNSSVFGGKRQRGYQ